MATGLEILASDVPASREVLKEGAAGQLVTASNATALGNDPLGAYPFSRSASLVPGAQSLFDAKFNDTCHTVVACLSLHHFAC